MFSLIDFTMLVFKKYPAGS